MPVPVSYPAALKAWHRREAGSVEWRLGTRGLQTRPGGILSPMGGAALQRARQQYGEAVSQVSDWLAVPEALLWACMLTESTGKAEALRCEPGYVSDQATPGKISVGLMQPLLSTARDVALRLPMLGLDPEEVSRDWLGVPENNLVVGAGLILLQAPKTQFDPPLVAAAYNAGGLYRDKAAGNPWKLRCYPLGTGAHISRFGGWFNAAWEAA